MSSPRPPVTGKVGRGLGLVAVALALVVGLVVTRSQRPIAGHPTAVPVLGPPAVGDCAATPAGLQPGEFALFDSRRDAGTFSPTYPPNDIEPTACTDGHYGEVVALIPNPGDVEITGADSDGYTITDPNAGSCWAAARDYVGVRTPIDAAGWLPSVSSNWALIGPTDRQRGAGQRWAACVIFLVNNPGDGSDAATSYRGTLRSAVWNGYQRDLLGFCGDDWSAAFAPGACTQPHGYELIATSRTVHSSSRDDARSRCLAEVQAETGIADLASISGLQVDLAATAADGTHLSGDTLSAGASLNCGISTTGTKKLRGSLRSIGSTPIPWA